MLIWMRDSTFGGVFKFLLLGFMTLAVAGLVLADVGGFFRGNLGSNTVAKGAGVKIGIQDFDRTVRRALAAQGIGAPEAYQLGLIDTILTSEIQNRLFTKEAKALGLEVGDEDVMRQISKLAEPLAANGRTKKEALQQILRTQNISEGEFVSAIRQEMANGLLRGALTVPATLSSPVMAKSLYRYDNEKRSADILVLKNSAVTDVTKPTDEQLQKYYDANKQDFLIPETRTITMATLKTDMIKKNVTISDEQLKGEYDKNIASFTKPPRRQVEQAVYPDEAAAKAAAEDAKAGKPLKDSNTQDFEEAGLLPEIGGPVFSAEKGAVVGPVQTALGWHVLKVKDLLPESVTPFADVKERLRDELSSIALTQELYNTGNAIEDRAAGGDKLEDIVSEYGMTTEIIGPFRQNGRDKDGNEPLKSYGADAAKIIQSAYDFDQGEIAPVVETADGQFHLIRVDQVIPDTYRDFAAVKSSLEKRWLDEQRFLANEARAKAALEAMNSGKSLADVAKENGGNVQKASGISRKAAPAAPLTPIVAAQIFSVDKGKSFSAEIEDGFIVGTVTDVTLSDVKPDEKELTALEDLTGRSLSQDIFGQYITGLSNGKPVKVNKPLLDQVYGQQQQVQ
jgi:peptidyl-prolyl cis-trans isomerase D